MNSHLETSVTHGCSRQFLIERIRTLISRILGLLMIVSCFFLSSWWDHTPGYKVFASAYYCMGCFMVGIGAMGRVWCSVYIAGYKTHTLVKEGPYSVCRNPLYFFSLVGGIGVGLTSETILLPVAIVLLFALYYPSVIHAEERRLTAIHGEPFREYCRQVPTFFPRWSQLSENEHYVVDAKIIRIHVMNAIWFVWIPAGFEAIEALHEYGLPYLFTIF
ncbi:MAG: isoprenylcysteine carboxylmethyltransferase family protein [Thermoguttaceae bacterium]|nr:isoprenylcysteine carboxylmethyltransferase family protein [Thermoguttaceae bacterium]